MTALSITSQSSGEMHVRVPIPRLTYLKQIMRSDSFDALWPLFKMANDPCKEFTESYAAMHHLRAWQRTPITVLHIGDGAHARTAALFSFMTKHWNVSIDPVADEAIIGNWSRQYAVERLAWFRGRVEDYPLEQWAPPGDAFSSRLYTRTSTWMRSFADLVVRGLLHIQTPVVNLVASSAVAGLSEKTGRSFRPSGESRC